MSVTGLCQVCENAPARHDCRYCGRQVCRDHWRETVGACVACAEAAGVDDGGDPSDANDPSDEDDPSRRFRID